MRSVHFPAFQQLVQRLELVCFPPGSPTASELTIAITLWNGLHVATALFPVAVLGGFRCMLSRSGLGLEPASRAPGSPLALLEPELRAKGHPLSKPGQAYNIGAAARSCKTPAPIGSAECAATPIDVLARKYAAIFASFESPLHPAFAQAWLAYDAGAPVAEGCRQATIWLGRLKASVVVVPAGALGSFRAALAGSELALESVRDADVGWAWGQLRVKGIPLPSPGESYEIRAG